MFMDRAGARNFRTIDPASSSVDNGILAQACRKDVRRPNAIAANFGR
jgi:hypothetical protein